MPGMVFVCPLLNYIDFSMPPSRRPFIASDVPFGAYLCCGGETSFFGTRQGLRLETRPSYLALRGRFAAGKELWYRPPPSPSPPLLVVEGILFVVLCVCFLLFLSLFADWKENCFSFDKEERRRVLYILVYFRFVLCVLLLFA